MVGIIALLAGNLIAKGQLAEFHRFLPGCWRAPMAPGGQKCRGALGLLLLELSARWRLLEWAVPKRDLEPFGVMLLGWGRFLLPSYTLDKNGSLYDPAGTES